MHITRMYVCLWVEKVDCSKTVRQIKMQESALERAIWMHSEASKILLLSITKQFLCVLSLAVIVGKRLDQFYQNFAHRFLMRDIPFEFVNGQHRLEISKRRPF